MSSQAPLWVTILVALVGFVGVLSAQFIAAWREDRRWRREQDREELRWQRERTKEIENRSHEGRQAAYADVIGAIEAFDWLVYPVIKAMRGGHHQPEDVAGVLRAREELRHSLGPVNLHAPKRFNELLRNAMLPRSELAMELARPTADRATYDRLWDRGQDGYRRLRAEMRKDLGLDAEVLPDGRPNDLDAGDHLASDEPDRADG